LLSLLAGLSLVILSSMPAAYAHGGGAPQLTNAEAGPYRLFAWTQPEPWRVGEAHISIAVTLPPAADAVVNEGVTNNALDTPVIDAVVMVMLAPANDSGQSLTVDALPQEQLGILYYEADADLPVNGDWRVTVQITGPEGSGSAEFVTEVLPTRSGSTLHALGGLILAVLALAALIGLRRRVTVHSSPP